MGDSRRDLLLHAISPGTILPNAQVLTSPYTPLLEYLLHRLLGMETQPN